eukprot:scaffold855_cov344-Prasinococcus_capsulatus_cf.AAC.19
MPVAQLRPSSAHGIAEVARAFYRDRHQPLQRGCGDACEARAAVPVVVPGVHHGVESVDVGGERPVALHRVPESLVLVLLLRIIPAAAVASAGGAGRPCYWTRDEDAAGQADRCCAPECLLQALGYLQAAGVALQQQDAPLAGRRLVMCLRARIRPALVKVDVVLSLIALTRTTCSERAHLRLRHGAHCACDAAIHAAHQWERDNTVDGRSAR